MSNYETKEIWKPVSGFEDYYHVSNFGNVKSLSRKYITGRGTLRTKNETLMSLSINPKGYVQINLTDGNIYKSVKVHRLVANEFISNPGNKPHVNHINGIKADNRAENLEWCTPKENTQHAFENGLVRIKKGIEHHHYRGKSPSSRKVIDTKTNKIFDSLKEAAEFNNMKHQTLGGQLRGTNNNKTNLKFL